MKKDDLLVVTGSFIVGVIFFTLLYLYTPYTGLFDNLTLTHTATNTTIEDIYMTYYEDGIRDGINGTINGSRQQMDVYRSGYKKGIDLKYCSCGDGVT